MHSMKIKRKLPDAPEPTRATFQKRVTGTYSPGMAVIQDDYIPVDIDPQEVKKIMMTDERAAEIKKKRQEAAERMHEANRRKSQARNKRVIGLYNAGLTTAQIAEQEGVCVRAMASRISKLKREGVLKDRELPEIHKTVIRLYNDGVPIAGIAEAVGMKETQIHTLLATLRKHGKVGNRCPKKWSEEVEAEFLKLWKDGYRQRDIAKMLGVSNSLVFLHTQELQRKGIIGRRKQCRELQE